MIDIVSPVMQAIAYMLLMIVLIVYYLKALRQPQLRSFWLLFALALTMNLLGNIVWIIRFIVTQTALDGISVVDLFYVASAILTGVALWRYPRVLNGRVWPWVVFAMSAAAFAVFFIYFGYVAPNQHGTFFNFIIYAAYPILDAGLITLAWIRYKSARGTRWTKITLLLALAITSYGLGNAIELTGYVLSPVFDGFLQNFFWILKQVLFLIVAFNVRESSDVLDE
jgi:hypothetical protein